MAEFTNVTVIKRANVYFEGRVTSRTILFADGSKKTLGIMLPGEYEFNTGAREIMEIMEGELDVQLQENDGWHSFKGGDSFEIPAHSKFSLRVTTPTDYCCSFIQ